MRLGNIEIPEITGHFKGVAGGLHVAREFIEFQPVIDLALGQGGGNSGASPGHGGELPFALAGLPFDFIDAVEFVQQPAFEPLLPGRFDGFFRRVAEGLLAGRR
jgi:hypothetical protein